MKPDDYEAWYDSPRGRWIGATEYRLLDSLLRPEHRSSLIDIGCGTGHFTRLFAHDIRGSVVGLDPNQDWLRYASTHGTWDERYVAGRAESLPFADKSFDFAISVTALCFIRNQAQALRELVRVTRRRFVLGLLNRNSVLYLQKSGNGTGGYQGAHRHTAAEIRSVLAPLPVHQLRVRSAIVLPQGNKAGQLLERFWPQRILLGGFLAIACDLSSSQ